MSKTQLVITAVVIQNRPVDEVAAEYGVSRSWLYELLARYRKEGDTAFQPRSRRPKRTPTATPADVVELIVELRETPPPAWTPARTPSAGTSNTTTASRWPGPRSRDTSERRAGGPGAEETTEVLLHPLPGRATQPVLAIRLHPLPTHQSRRRPGEGCGDLVLARRLLEIRALGHRPRPGHRQDRSRRSGEPLPHTGSRPPR